MKLASLVIACLIVFPALLLRAAESDPIRIRDSETVVFYGDSITEQNLYTAYLETFLISRFPRKKIKFFNFGWGGDTAAGGLKRFARDAAPVRPTLVFVNYGMNDGGYRAFDPEVLRAYIDAERRLAAEIRGIGAREVLFTATPVDEDIRGDKGEYNNTLSRLGKGIGELGNELNLPVIDLFQPMLGILRSVNARAPKLSLIPDAVHPNAAGHLLMAYTALRRIDAPRVAGEINISGGKLVKADGAAVEHFFSDDGGLTEFDLALPFLPFYVPTEARPALTLVPFEEELNRFRLRMETNGDQPWNMSVDGVTVGSFTVAQLRNGIDMALLEKAPWAVDGRALWEAAQLRWHKHFEAWRLMGLDGTAGALPDRPALRRLASAQRAYADELGASLSPALPRPYHVMLWRSGVRVSIKSVELSPAYPRESFGKVYSPETGEGNVLWKTVPLENGRIDLGAHFNGQTDIVSYSRVILQADKAVTLRLSMGSDDGLAVILNGRRVFSHDIRRPLRAGEDETAVRLLPGRNELLFMVTQGVGGYALSVEAEIIGRAADVHQL